MVTLAPELPGALDLVGALSARGVVVALGHTDADDETVRRAVAAGAGAATHLFGGSLEVDAVVGTDQLHAVARNCLQVRAARHQGHVVARLRKPHAQ